MAKVTTEITIPCNIIKVWDKIVNQNDYGWRSDIDKLTTLNETTFIETSKEGIETTFSITTFIPYERYAFTIDNKNMHGYWEGVFKEKDQTTIVSIEEDVTVKHWFMKLFVKGYLKKQQRIYQEDLKRACESLSD